MMMKKFRKICLDINRTRKVIENFELLVDVAVTDNAWAIKYATCIPNYRDDMIILRQHLEFTDDDIEQFQNHMDTWFQKWMQQHASEGCTNYTHQLSSRHIAEYMLKWRNMYRFSQQGWENFNHVFTTYYFGRMNHGGRRHAGAVKSKLIRVGRWLQRRLSWMTELGDEIINRQHTTVNKD
jgi:hypothetical protein